MWPHVAGAAAARPILYRVYRFAAVELLLSYPKIAPEMISDAVNSYFFFWVVVVGAHPQTSLVLRCIKDWMNTKNTLHLISLERKMI